MKKMYKQPQTDATEVSLINQIMGLSAGDVGNVPQPTGDTPLPDSGIG